MAKGLIGASGCKAHLGAVKMRKGYIGATRVYSGSNIVTYCCDSGVSYQEEVDEGSSCLSPKTFAPTKSGWTFVGWRTDSTANGTVLTSKAMGDDPVTLYAVFRKSVTVTYYNNSTTASSTSGYRYYNNGNTANPSFTLTQSSRSGWAVRGWSTSISSTGDIAYNNATAFSRDSNITLYGMYQQTITVTYYDNSTTASTTTGIRYYNSGKDNTTNASFTLTQTARSGWTARGWSTFTAGNGTISYNNGTAFSRDSNITLYGMYQQTITVDYYNGSTSKSTTSGTRYYNSGSGNVVNPSFTLTQAALSGGWSARGWSTGTSGNSGISYNNGTTFTRDSNVTLYGMYYQTITVTYYNNSATASTTSGTRYYNSNGNTVNPSFTLSQAARSGWTVRGWSTSTAGNGAISYNNGTSFTRDSNITLYGMYQQTITLTYYNGSTTAASTSGTRYYNSGSGNAVNPAFSLTPTTFGGWTFRGWATSSAATAGIAYSSITNTAFAASATVYAAYSQTITLSYNGNGSTGGSTASQTGTRYYNTGNYSNPSFTLATNGFSKTNYAFQMWAYGSASGTQYSAGASVTLSANTTFYAVWKVAETTIWNGTSLASGIGLAGVWDNAGKLLSYCTAAGDEDGGEEEVKQVSITGINLTGYSTLTVTSTIATSCSFGEAYVKFGIDTADKIFFNLPPGTSYNIRTETGTIDVSGYSGVHSLVFYQYANSDSTYYGHMSCADIEIKQIVLK